MNPRDLFLGISSAIVFGLIAWQVWRGIRRSGRFECPQCKKRVELEAIRPEGILCPHCGWQVARVADTDGITDTLREEAGQIELWDGHFYSIDELESHCPELLSHARAHPILEEEAPYSVLRVSLRQFLIAGGAMNLVFGTIAFLAGWQQGGLLEALQYLMAINLLFMPIAIVFVGAAAYALATQRPIMSIAKGEGLLRSGKVASRRIPLNECEWFHGTATYNTIGNTPIPGGKVILLVMPRKKGDDNENFVAVGYTEEMRRVWADFLSLTGIPHRTAWEKKRHWTTRFAHVIGGLLAIVAGCVVWVYALALIGDLVAARFGGAQFVEALRMIFTVFGCITIALYVATLWPWRALPRVEAQRSSEELQEHRRSLFVRLLLVLMMMPTSIVLISMKGAWGPRLAIFAAVSLVATLIAADLSRRMAYFEWAKQTEEISE